jgi:hypothetical protein
MTDTPTGMSYNKIKHPYINLFRRRSVSPKETKTKTINFETKKIGARGGAVG